MRLKRSQPMTQPPFGGGSFLTRGGQRSNSRRNLSLDTTFESPRTADSPVESNSDPGWANSVANPNPGRKMGNPQVMTSSGQRGH